jgi:ferredoxin-type protein NapG
MDRRGFFTRGLRELLRPMADAAVEKITEVESVLKPLAGSSANAKAPQYAPQYAPSSHLPLLRPPGALLEADFLQACTQCKACVNACPAQCIRIEPQEGGRAGGRPFIIAQESPCVVCKGLDCMFVCPSGALSPTRFKDIHMGLAQWSESACLLSQGQQCDKCVQMCPMGEVAIKIENGRVVVLEGCTGCGMCEHHCPTRPARAINVKPREVIA